MQTGYSNRPRVVVIALIALSLAWISSATALAVNQIVSSGSGMGPGPVLGIASLALQAVTIGLLARASNTARTLVVFFAVLSGISLPLVPRAMGSGSTFFATYLVLSFVLKTVATVLIFTRPANRWFMLPAG